MKAKQDSETNRKTAVQPDRDTAIYLIHGNDDFSVEQAAHELVNTLCPAEQQALNLETIDGDTGTVDGLQETLKQCLEGVQTQGFFGGGKVVWLRRGTMFSNERIMRSKRSKGLIEDFTGAIKNLDRSACTLVLSTGKLDKRKALVKTFQAAGKVWEFSAPEKEYQQTQGACEKARESAHLHGLRIEDGLLGELVVRTGTDTRQIEREMEKLSLYVEEGKAVTLQDIKTIVSISAEAQAWDLADAAGERNLQDALDVLSRLGKPDDQAIALVIMLENRFRDLLILRQCLDRKWVSLQQKGAHYILAAWHADEEADRMLAALPRDPRKTHPYRTGLLLKQARRYNRQELIRGYQKTVETHRQLVSGSGAGIVLIELLLLQILTSETSRK